MLASQFLRPIPSDVSHTKAFSQLPKAASGEHQQCEIDVSLEIISDLQRLVQNTRLGPETFDNSQPETDIKHGVSRAWLQGAVDAWTDGSAFNWSEIQASINALPHFNALVEHKNESYSIHYTALFSQCPTASAIVLIHGWPGSFLEFQPLMSLLQQSYDPSTLPYHIIAPSMPGYTFSSGASSENSSFTVLDTCDIFRKLLSSLGFSASKPYVVQGGDIGSRVARGLGVLDPACSAVHLNFCFDLPMKSFPRDELSAKEANKIDTFLQSGTGYAVMHATRPSTISFILSSSPVALLAWLGEKYYTWSDAPHLDLTTILTFVTVYWITDTMPRSIYPYKADFNPSDEIPNHGNPNWNVPKDKPFGFSYFPGELFAVPRSWVERTGEDRYVWWREHESGGHFAALERPAEMLADLKSFVEVVREKRKDS